MVKQHADFRITTDSTYYVLPHGFSCTPFFQTYTCLIEGMQQKQRTRCSR